MKDILPLAGIGHWYKGNLHCHSTMSDGKLDPYTIVEMYKKKGYCFLAFSEHELFTAWKEFNDDNFIIMPGIERSVPKTGTRKCYHIHGILGSSEYISSNKLTPLEHKERVPVPQWNGKETAQKIINELRENGNLVMINHPLWSYNELEDLVGLEGYHALEIYNHGCEVENKTGMATVYWDSLLRRGVRIWGIATDDNHNNNRYEDAHPEWDSFGGWVSVKAEKLSQESIAKSLLEGRFYSSTGPEIYNYGIKDGIAFVECSPVQTIYFLSYEGRGESRRNKEGKPVTYAECTIDDKEKYVRIECIDEFGKTAWSNPMYL
jgi:predicted metal-dependent phosphoesterase TrpH